MLRRPDDDCVATQDSVQVNMYHQVAAKDMVTGEIIRGKFLANGEIHDLDERWTLPPEVRIDLLTDEDGNAFRALGN